MGKLFSKSSTSRHKSVHRHEAQDDEAEDMPHIHGQAVTCVCPVRNGVCLSGGHDKAVILYDFDNNTVLDTWRGHSKEITKVAYADQTDCIYSASRDKTIKLWKPGTAEAIATLKGHDLVVTGISLSPENKKLISGSRDNSVRLWDITTGNLMSESTISRNLVTDICWSKSDNLAAQTSEDKEVRIWDPRLLKVVIEFPKKQYIQTSCDVTQDGNYCVTTSNGSGSNGCEATLWDIRTQKLLRELKGHEESVGACSFFPNTHMSDLVVTAGNDCTVRVWDINSGDIKYTHIIGGSGPLTRIAPFNDNRMVISSFKVGLQCVKLTNVSGQISIDRYSQF